MRKLIWALGALILSMWSVSALAETWAVGSGVRYRFQAQYRDGFACLGGVRGLPYPVYYQTGDNTPTEDGWWYIEPDQSASTDEATYVVRNAVSGEVMSWIDNYQDYRYMYLTSGETTDECRWRIVRVDGDWLGFINVAYPSYSWNVRTGTGLLGNYSSYPNSNNSLFYIVDEDGNHLEEGDPADLVPMTDITLQYTGLKMPVGSTMKLDWSYLPAEATDTRVQWTSSKSSIVGVNAKGELTALAAGTSTITVAGRKGSATATCNVQVYEPGEGGGPVGGDSVYVFLANGRMDAFPRFEISKDTRSDKGDIDLVMNDGSVWHYDHRGIDSVTSHFHGQLPELLSYKFNNKFNDNLLVDIAPKQKTRVVNGVEEAYMPASFRVWITSCIGKRLTASYKLSSEDCAVYIDGEEQISKVTRRRYDNGKLDLLVAPRSYKVYRSTGRVIYDTSDPDNPKPISGENEGYEMLPFGRHYQVTIAFAVDDSDSQYNLPEVHINTADGQMITSKALYKNATIRIEGNSVFPDLAETPILIKGRGNSSWGGGYSKEPYHFKFDSKQKVLGMTSGKHWVLLANKQSGSMTSNALALRMANMVGTPATNHCVPVEFYLNGEYRGSYNMTEKIGFSNNSIDLEDESGAVLLQLDSYYDEAYKWNDPTYNLPNMVMEPDLQEIAAVDKMVANNQFNAIKEHWNRFTSTVFNGSYGSRVDPEALARSMFVTDLSRNTELKHPKSWYVYNESALAPNGDGTFSLNIESPYVFGPVWDFDWGYGYDGTGQYYVYEADKDLFSVSGAGVGLAFFRQLLRGDEEVKKAYYRLWYDFMNNGKLEELLEYCDDYYQFAKPSFEHNATRWSDGRDYQRQTDNAKSWLEKRANYIFSNLTPYEIDDDDVITVGDVNEDGAITAADVVCLLNYIHGIENESFSFRQADTDKNDLVTMRDAVSIISLIMGQQPNRTRQWRLPQAEGALTLSPFQAQVGESCHIPVNLVVGEGQYSGMQMDVHVPEGCELTDITLPLTLQNNYSARVQWVADGTYRVVLYATTEHPLPLGRSRMELEMTVEHELPQEACLVSVTQPMLVNAQAEDERLAASSVHFRMPGHTDGIQRTEEESQQGATYDLAGRRVQHTQHGIYITNGKKLVR